VKDREIDEMLSSAPLPPGPDPEALRRIADSIKPSMAPVRPLWPNWALTGGLVLICAAVAFAGAARAGFSGVEKMDWLERALVFSALGLFAWAAASVFVRAMIPGSRRRISAGALLAACCAGLAGVFALLFRDYHSTHFVSAGLLCLVTGIAHAAPTALLGWLLLRRGFAVRPVAAGLAAGTLAGLAGVGVLELHCVNFEAAHILVWHTAVVPLSAVAGALIGLIVSQRRKPA